MIVQSTLASDPQRMWGTAASVTACVAGKADIVRVHDVKEMKAVMSVADAIFRPPAQEVTSLKY